MKMKKIVSAISALTIAVSSFAAMATVANAASGYVIYSNDFSEKDLLEDGAVTGWCAAGKSPSGYENAKVGRAGTLSLENEALHWIANTSKSGSNVSNASYGYFSDEIETATKEKNYKISFDWNVTTTHVASNAAIELINTDKNVILGLNLKHTRANSSVGANTVKYYNGGLCGFAVKEAQSKGNAEGYLGSADKVDFYADANTTTNVTFNVEMTVETNGLATLTIKNASDNTILVDAADVRVDAGVGLSDIYLTGSNNNGTPVHTMSIDNLSIVEAEESTATLADYKVKFKLADGTPVKDEDTRNGVVGESIVLSDDDIADFKTADGTKKYIYVSNDSATSSIAADGTSVCTVTFREAETFGYAATTSLGTILKTGSDFEGETITTPYSKYENNNGTLWQTGTTSNQYKASFVLSENNQSEVVEYSETDISNVVYYSEAEDITGLTTTTSGNISIRSSNCAAAYAGEDTVITTLQPGSYKVYGVIFAGNSNGANLKFALGTNEFNFAYTTSANWTNVNSEEITITKATDLTFLTSGASNAALDFIYVVKTGDYVAPAATYEQVGEDYTTTTGNTTEDSASLFKLTITAGSEAITSVGVKVNDTAADKTVETNITGGTAVFAVVVNALAEAVTSMTAVINNADVTATVIE